MAQPPGGIRPGTQARTPAGARRRRRGGQRVRAAHRQSARGPSPPRQREKGALDRRRRGKLQARGGRRGVDNVDSASRILRRAKRCARACGRQPGQKGAMINGCVVLGRVVLVPRSRHSSRRLNLARDRPAAAASRFCHVARWRARGVRLLAPLACVQSRCSSLQASAVAGARAWCA